VPERARAAAIEQAVLAQLTSVGPLTIAGVAEAVGVTLHQARWALRKLRRDDQVRVDGENRHARWTIASAVVTPPPAPAAPRAASYDDARDVLEDLEEPDDPDDDDPIGLEEALDDGAEADVAAELPPPPRWSTPLRRKPTTVAPGATVPRTQRAPTPVYPASAWVDVGREGFTARMAGRAVEMSNTREGRSHQPLLHGKKLGIEG